MVALQMSPKIELYGLGRQAKNLYKVRDCMEFCNFCKAPIGQFQKISIPNHGRLSCFNPPLPSEIPKCITPPPCPQNSIIVNPPSGGALGAERDLEAQGALEAGGPLRPRELLGLRGTLTPRELL